MLKELVCWKMLELVKRVRADSGFNFMPSLLMVHYSSETLFNKKNLFFCFDFVLFVWFGFSDLRTESFAAILNHQSIQADGHPVRIKMLGLTC